MKSLYAQYILEKTERKIIESDDGFITYEIDGERCYIADIFVVKEKRLQGIAMKMCLQVGEIAIAQGCKFIIGTVQVMDKESTESLNACIKMGMRLVRADNGFVYLIREL